MPRFPTPAATIARAASALLVLGCVAPVEAGNQTDDRATNPAFCLGFLEAHTPAIAATLAARPSGIEARYAKEGPKDSTDERGFTDWRQIGRTAAADTNSPIDTGAIAPACRRLLGLD